MWMKVQILVLLCFLVCDAYTLSVTLRNFLSNPSRKCYGVVFDAGSSGTRVYVYKWECRKTFSTPKVDIAEQIPEFKINPGIALFKDNPQEAGPSLEPLITYAKKIIPNDQLSWTPIFLRATAGMRLITLDQQEAILSSIRKTFKNSGFKLQKDEWVRVITGEEEGKFGWVATNYLHNLIRNDIKPQDTRAMIECGGASVQITFVQPTQPPINKIEVSFPDINTYNLYTFSYLGYGQDRALEAVIKQRIKPNNPGIVECPCLHSGYNNTNVYSEDPSLRVIGTGNSTACIESIASHFNVSNSCTDCSINGNYYPNIPNGMTIDGVSAFSLPAVFFELKDSSYTTDQLWSVTEGFCKRNWTDVVKNFGSTHQESYLRMECFTAIYMRELLVRAFKIQPTVLINANQKIGNVSVAWTLGSILYDMAQLECAPGTEDCIYNDNTTLIVAITVPTAFVTLLLIVAAIALVTAVVKTRRKDVLTTDGYYTSFDYQEMSP
ncbi:ectonucleoside triphosphate diphosphohydrolase [Acrasis kona]|uniref:Ectonucleoside triphosphate diphosphohydrolase n=1 Tax=Acrasis kona TaxID=1008807 RepID=A0AAW2ZBL7_9EUKA